MLIVHCALVLLFLSVLPSESLKCYECGCDNSDYAACDCGGVSDFDDGSYCAIFETRTTGITYIELSRIDRNSTYIYIEDPYYILIQESIRYRQSDRTWNLVTTGSVFGCDWDFCNAPSLIDVLPTSFQLTIDDAWLTQNIYGTGSVAGCHHCPEETCGNKTNPVGLAQCPIVACTNGSTTCITYDFWNDVSTGEQCYQSECAPAYLNEPGAELLGGKYRVDVEAIVYLEKNRTKYDVWEIDVYCGAPNCSRSSIFDEILQKLSGSISDVSGFPIVRPLVTEPPLTTLTPNPNPLECFACECVGATSCPCDTTETVMMGYTYCVLIRENFGQESYIYSGHLNLDETYVYIREFPYALVEESITYNEGNGRWFTTTNFVIYGCNWNKCNKPELVSLLPNSFQMRLPEVWLNSSVLGSGLPVRNCHECPSEPQCGTSEFLTENVCPIQPCNTTCLVVDSFDDPDYDFLCYQSFCLPPDSEYYQYDQHRIEIEGAVYASQPNVVQLWEIDIYCRADDCSRPGIFKELRDKLSVQPGTLSALFNETYDPNIPQRRCYDCYCYDDPVCECDRVTVQRADNSYCTILRQSLGQDMYVSYGHIDRDSTRVYIRDFPYLLVEESIVYSERRGIWDTITNLVVYGCNWDYCNHPRYLAGLPGSFQMRLPEAWLNTSVLGTGQPVRDCHECPSAPQCGSLDFLDASRCPIRDCNTTCLVFDTFNDPAKDEQCYQSFCAPPDTVDYQIDSHRVEMEGILYLNKQPREVELWEIDIYCRADDCSNPEIFKDVRAKFTVQLGDLSIFSGQSTPGTTGGPMASTTMGPGTTGGPTTTGSQTTAMSRFNMLLLLIVVAFCLY